MSLKQCSLCRQYKDRETGYYVSYNRDGTASPRSVCKECTDTRRRDNQQKEVKHFVKPQPHIISCRCGYEGLSEIKEIPALAKRYIEKCPVCPRPVQHGVVGQLSLI